MSTVQAKWLSSRWLRLGIAVAAVAVPAAAQRAPLFKSEILPVLEKNCVSCHGDQKKMAALDLSTFSGVMAGGGSGPLIAPGKPERRLLWKSVQKHKKSMGGKV